MLSASASIFLWKYKPTGRLSRDVYKRFLSLRMDQLPKSVGSLASQMRGYESVRN
jgi:hypothetical protein